MNKSHTRHSIYAMCFAIFLPFATLAKDGLSSDDLLLFMDASNKTIKAILADTKGETSNASELRKDALKDFDNILTRNPEDVRSLIARGKLKDSIAKNSGKQDLEQAITLATAALTKNPNDFNSFGLRGDAYSGLKKYENARADYNSAIAMAHENEKTLLQSKLKIMETDIKIKEYEAVKK
jgi:tetratricopeptide (TPR) repeat protein